MNHLRVVATLSPTAPCAWCHKPGCTFCLGSGWLPSPNAITAAWIAAAVDAKEVAQETENPD